MITPLRRDRMYGKTVRDNLHVPQKFVSHTIRARDSFISSIDSKTEMHRTHSTSRVAVSTIRSSGGRGRVVQQHVDAPPGRD
jgi:hypothetical protein